MCTNSVIDKKYISRFWQACNRIMQIRFYYKTKKLHTSVCIDYLLNQILVSHDKSIYWSWWQTTILTYGRFKFGCLTQENFYAYYTHCTKTVSGEFEFYSRILTSKINLTSTICLTILHSFITNDSTFNLLIYVNTYKIFV